MNRIDSPSNSTVILNNRKEFSVDGVVDILAFDETNLLIRTVCGDLSLDGDGFRVISLSLEEGKMSLEGRLDGLLYLSEESKKSKKKNRFSGNKG